MTGVAAMGANMTEGAGAATDGWSVLEFPLIEGKEYPRIS